MIIKTVRWIQTLYWQEMSLSRGILAHKNLPCDDCFEMFKWLRRLTGVGFSSRHMRLRQHSFCQNLNDKISRRRKITFIFFWTKPKLVILQYLLRNIDYLLIIKTKYTVTFDSSRSWLYLLLFERKFVTRLMLNFGFRQGKHVNFYCNK